MNYRRNIISGGIIFLFGAVYFLLSFQIPTFKGLGSTPIDARFVPQMWGVALMLLSSILLIRGFLERAKLLKASSKAASISWRNLLIKNREVILSFVVLAVYITLLKRVGFLLMSAAYVFVMVIILSPEGKKKPWISGLIMGVVLSIIVDFIFVRLLNVMLPQGILGF